MCDVCKSDSQTGWAVLVHIDKDNQEHQEHLGTKRRNGLSGISLENCPNADSYFVMRIFLNKYLCILIKSFQIMERLKCYNFFSPTNDAKRNAIDLSE